MSQCVPNWNLDETPPAARFTLHPNSNPVFTAQDETMLDYEVAELTWVNGHLAMQGLGPPRILNKTLSNSSKTTWDKPRANGTLESIVNQATTLRPSGDEQVPLFNPHSSSSAVAVAGDRLTVDALVPCSNPKTTTSGDDQSTHVRNPNPVPEACVVECSTRVGSCSGAAMAEIGEGEEEKLTRKRMRVARVPVAHEGSSRIQSESTSATFGGDSISRQVTLDTCEMDLDVGLTSTSMGSPSPGNTSTGKPSTVDDHDSVCHSKPQKEVGNDVEKKKNQTGKSSISTKRSRAAAIHNQSERKRRDKINQRMKTLQKMVPNSSKTDKASMLDEVIEYLKQLQAQVQMMSRINMPQMMLPMTMQQQLQMSMMAQMGIGVGMGMGMGMGVMDINSIARPNIPGISPVMHPSPFMPLNSWDNSGDRVCSPSTVMPDPLSTFLACQTQPMTMDAYSRMAALYQQLHQQLGSNPKT